MISYDFHCIYFHLTNLKKIITKTIAPTMNKIVEISMFNKLDKPLDNPSAPLSRLFAILLVLSTTPVAVSTSGFIVSNVYSNGLTTVSTVSELNKF